MKRIKICFYALLSMAIISLSIHAQEATEFASVEDENAEQTQATEQAWSQEINEIREDLVDNQNDIAFESDINQILEQQEQQDYQESSDQVSENTEQTDEQNGPFIRSFQAPSNEETMESSVEQNRAPIVEEIDHVVNDIEKSSSEL